MIKYKYNLTNFIGMITYKYSLKEDLRWAYRTVKNRKWLEEKNLKYFFPNIFRMIVLWFRKPNINFQSDQDVYCYWVHANTWGAYTPPNKIFICPWHIDEAGGFERVIKHEIKHLELFDKIRDMSHEDKEKFIKNAEK